MIPFVDLKAQYQAYKDSINARIQNVLERSDFILGQDVHELEEKMAEYVGAYTVSASSGTDALLIPLMAQDLQPGDEIITTPFSFFATVEVILLLKLKPVFVDINSNTCNIDTSKIEAAITPRTKGIISVSLYGQTSDLDVINDIARKYNIFHMEDAAQSLGAVYKGQMSGSVAEMSATSLFPAKSLGAYGDAGLMFFRDKKFADECRIYMNHGQESRYNHKYVGINGRLDTLQAAVTLAKFEHYETELSKRQELADFYNQAFNGTSIRFVERSEFTDKHVWAQYSIKVKNRESFAAYLANKGIPTAVHYPKPLHLQPALGFLGLKEGAFPVAEQISKEIISLPMHAFISLETRNLIADNVIKALEHSSEG